MTEKEKLELEIGKLFIEIEQAKAFVAQAMPKLNELLKQIKELE
jgi:archaellum component FlaC